MTQAPREPPAEHYPRPERVTRDRLLQPLKEHRLYGGKPRGAESGRLYAVGSSTQPGQFGDDLAVVPIGLENLDRADVLQGDAQDEQRKFGGRVRHAHALQPAGRAQKQPFDREAVAVDYDVAADRSDERRGGKRG